MELRVSEVEVRLLRGSFHSAGELGSEGGRVGGLGGSKSWT